ncbi:MAG: serine/threonine-protein kinase, partial [Pyrinomonadaceae bacterium]
MPDARWQKVKEIFDSAERRQPEERARFVSQACGGKCFGHYEIIEQIGAGGMGEVYLALDKKLDRKVAVKILNEHFSQHDANLQRFIREAKSASALNHPNILVIHEIGETDGTHYIVSEFVKGKTLREICNEKALTLAEVLGISIEIANALCTAHEAHLVHRDIKPENIMISSDGYAKVLDFGLAKYFDLEQAAPERFQSH